MIYRVLDNNVEGKEHIEEKDQSVHKDPTSASPLRYVMKKVFFLFYLFVFNSYLIRI